MTHPCSYLVTGAAGFIGFHLAQRLLGEGHTVTGADSLNDYYDPQLKHDRLALLESHDAFQFRQLDVADAATVGDLFDEARPEVVVHLAAQVGVRYSLKEPAAFVQSNLVGFGNVIEACRRHAVKHLVYASSSSVYGANRAMPFATDDNVDHPVSLYAATKKANELVAHAYSHLYGLPTTGLRFFTVYGPWGRPDMALFLFAEAILEGRPLDLFNGGEMRRDFTYVGDVVEAVVRVAERPPVPDDSWSAEDPSPDTSGVAPYRVFNVGSQRPVELLAFVEALELALGKTAVLNPLPLQPGDVLETYADVSALAEATGYEPATPLGEGVREFAAWYLDYRARREREGPPGEGEAAAPIDRAAR